MEGQAPPPRRNNTATIVIAIIGGCLVFGLVGIMVMAAVLFPVFAQAREAARKSSCMSQAKQLGNAMMMYAMDYDNRFPPAAQWQTALTPYVGPGVGTSCPSRPGILNPYAFNSKHSGLSLGKIKSPAAAPQLFESSAGLLNASDPLTSFTMPHMKSGIISYSDGHVKAETTAPSATAGLN
jgi:hypothetical protein